MLAPIRSPNNDAEYQTNALTAGSIGALYALDNGWDGSGVLVGVLDEGVVETSELQGQISSLGKDFGGIRENGVTRPHETLGDEQSAHGTLVASIIAAKNDGKGVQGLAPGAQIVVLRSDLQNLDNGQSYVGVNSHEAIRYAGENGVLIVNRSLSKVIPDIANRLMQQAVADYRGLGGIVVNAAGNSGGANPNDAIDLTQENREGWLFVVAADPATNGYELASYSNQCGIAMDRCVAAMGTSITADKDGKIVSFSGTSAAAPQASSLAALILEKWPQLSGVDAGNIILATAKDIGDVGVDTVFGHGLISVEGALAPVEPTLSNGSSETALIANGMQLPAALGGTGSNAETSVESALSSVTILDTFGRNYQADLTGLVERSSRFRSTSLEREISDIANLTDVAIQTGAARAKFGYVVHPDGPYRSLQGEITDADFTIPMPNGKSTIGMSFRQSDAPERMLLGLAPASDALRAYLPLRGMSGTFDHRTVHGSWGLEFHQTSASKASARAVIARYGYNAATLKLGLIDEQGSVFGTPTGSGNLRFGDGAVSAFAELSAAFRLDAWDLSTSASIGTTNLKLADDTLVTRAGPIRTARLGFTASRPWLSGRISLNMAQPLLAISGTASVKLATGYDVESRELEFSTRQIALSGTVSPRITVGYERFGTNSQLKLGVGSGLDGTDLKFLGSWRVRLK